MRGGSSSRARPGIYMSRWRSSARIMRYRRPAGSRVKGERRWISRNVDEEKEKPIGYLREIRQRHEKNLYESTRRTSVPPGDCREVIKPRWNRANRDQRGKGEIRNGGDEGRRKRIRSAARQRGETHTGFQRWRRSFFYSFFFYKKAFIQVQKDAWLKSRALCIKKIVCISWRRMYVLPETRRRPLCNPDRSFRRR